MANRRFEVFELRQILVRMRLGESDRDLSKSGLIGRKKGQRDPSNGPEHGLA
jgi:hypothetical protein